MSTNIVSSPVPQSRVPELLATLSSMIEATSGIDVGSASASIPFVELGLDSLSLTQIALRLKQTFKVNITFRQLMERYRSLESLAMFLDNELPAAAPSTSAVPSPAMAAMPAAMSIALQPAIEMPANPANGSLVQQVIQQQMHLMAQQLALLQGVPAASLAPLRLRHRHHSPRRVKGQQRYQQRMPALGMTRKVWQPTSTTSRRPLGRSPPSIRMALRRLPNASVRVSIPSCGAMSHAPNARRTIRRPIVPTWPIRASSTDSVLCSRKSHTRSSLSVQKVPACGISTATSMSMPSMVSG